VTSEAAGHADEQASTAAELREQAESTRGLVHVFRLRGEQRSGPARTRAPRLRAAE
jgi:hypothetical protein